MIFGWIVGVGFSEVVCYHDRGTLGATTWCSPTHAWSWRVTWDGGIVREGRAECDRKDAQREAEVLIAACLAGDIEHPHKGSSARQETERRLLDARSRALADMPIVYLGGKP